MRLLFPWAAATLALLSSAATAASIDPLGELARIHVQTLGHDDAKTEFTTSRLLDHLLATPSSNDSELVPASQVPWTSKPWWRSYVRQLRSAPGAPKDDALVLLRLQMGATRAVFSNDSDVPAESRVSVGEGERTAYATPYRKLNDHAIANAIEAGISPPVFWKAWDFNSEMTTVAATEAVAVQTLIDWMLSVPRTEWDAMGLRPDVVFRYLDAITPQAIIEEDRQYLRFVVERILASGELIAIPSPDTLRHPQSSEILSRLPYGKVVHGSRTRSVLRIPAAYRVARVAAAYDDASHDTATPCRAGASWRAHSMADVDNGLPLCFVTATDRAVHRWYTVEARRQAREMERFIAEQDQPPQGLGRLLQVIGVVFALLDLASFAEEAFAMAEETSAEALVDEASSTEASTARCAGDAIL